MHRLHALPGACSLESEDGQERAPPGIGDALRQGVVLDHGADPQVFMVDHVVLLDELAGFLVVEVAPLVAHVLVGLGEQHHRLAPAVTALLPSADSPLGTPQIQLRHAEDARGGDRAAIRQGREGLQAEGNSGLLTRERQGLDRHLRAGEADVPAVGLTGERDRLGRARDRTGPMHAEAPDLGQDQGAVIELSAVAIRLEGEAVEAVAALEAGEAGFLAALHPAKERLIGLIQPGEHILQHVAIDGHIFGKLGADGREFGFLLVAREGDAPLPVQADALLHGGVVELAATPEHLVQRPLLGRRGPQLLFVGLAHGLWHGYTSRLRHWRGMYSRTARTTSLLMERSFAAANCLMASATWRGNRMVMRVSSRAVLMVT